MLECIRRISPEFLTNPWSLTISRKRKACVSRCGCITLRDMFVIPKMRTVETKVKCSGLLSTLSRYTHPIPRYPDQDKYRPRQWTISPLGCVVTSQTWRKRGEEPGTSQDAFQIFCFLSYFTAARPISCTLCCLTLFFFLYYQLHNYLICYQKTPRQRLSPHPKWRKCQNVQTVCK